MLFCLIKTDLLLRPAIADRSQLAGDVHLPLPRTLIEEVDGPGRWPGHVHAFDGFPLTPALLHELVGGLVDASTTDHRSGSHAGETHLAAAATVHTAMRRLRADLRVLPEAFVQAVLAGAAGHGLLCETDRAQAERAARDLDDACRAVGMEPECRVVAVHTALLMWQAARQRADAQPDAARPGPMIDVLARIADVMPGVGACDGHDVPALVAAQGPFALHASPEVVAGLFDRLDDAVDQIEEQQGALRTACARFTERLGWRRRLDSVRPGSGDPKR